jgi:hypothetical protein
MCHFCQWNTQELTVIHLLDADEVAYVEVVDLKTAGAVPARRA